MPAIVDLGEYAIESDALRLVRHMDRIMAIVEETYASQGVPFPSRHYWMTGEPAYDCEQAVLSLVQVYLGTPGDQAARPVPCTSPLSASYTISIVRPTAPYTTSGKTPTAENIQKAAGISAVDTMVLGECIRTLDVWEDGTKGLGAIATIQARTPSGEYQAVEMAITLVIP